MKTAIVFEGGASRSLFSCGVMDVLLKNEIYSDYVIGASAGISMGVSYTSRQYRRNYEITKKYMSDKRYMGASHLIDRKNKSYYNLDFVFDEIPNKLIPFDYESYEKYKGNCIAVVTNVNTGKPEYIEVEAEDKGFTALRASCALPILFPMIEINGEKYLDGGISDAVPYERAISDGCDKVIVVLTRERGYIKKTDPSVKLACKLYKKYPGLCECLKNRAQNYNEQIKRLREAENAGKVFVIEPLSTMGVRRTEKRWKKLLPLYNHGEEMTELKLRVLKKYLEE